MESLADGLFVAVGGLTIAAYSGLLFLGARPVWAIVLVLAGAIVLGILLNSALAILRDVSASERSKQPAVANAEGSEARTKDSVPQSQPKAGRAPIGESI